MMWKCKDCGAVFEEPLQERWTDRFEGQTYGGIDEYCPECKSQEFEEAIPCLECNEFVGESELHNGICKSCLYDEALDADTAYFYGQEHKETVEINGLLAYLFDGDELEEALLKLALVKFNNGDHAKYCMDDPDSFSDFIKRQLFKEVQDEQCI